MESSFEANIGPVGESQDLISRARVDSARERGTEKMKGALR